MSPEAVHNQGIDIQGKTLDQQRTTVRQLIREKRVFEKVGDERNAAAREVVKEMGGAKGQKVQDWVEAARDPNRTQEQKEQSMARIRLLGGVVYDQFVHAGVEENTALVLGPGAIDKMLPEPFKGLGEVMADKFATVDGEHGGIVRRLRVVDEAINKNTHPLVREGILGIIAQERRKISEFEVEPGNSRQQSIKAAALKCLGEVGKRYGVAEIGSRGQQQVNAAGMVDEQGTIVSDNVDEYRGISLLPPFVDPKNPLAGAIANAGREPLRLSPEGLPKDIQKESEVNAWIRKIVVEHLQSSPMTFAQWWQTPLCQTLDERLGEIIENDGRLKGDTKKQLELREYYKKQIYGSTAAIGYYEMLTNSDQALPNLKSWSPPAEMLDIYRWSKEKLGFFLEDPMMAMCYRRVFNLAYEVKPEYRGRGWEVVEAASLKDGDLTKKNEFCLRMTEDILGKEGGEAWKNYAEKHGLDVNNRRAIQDAFMVAIDIFWVENGAEYINHLNKNDTYERANGIQGERREYQWYAGGPAVVGEKPRTVALKYRDGSGQEKKMDWSHPLPIYPSDVWVIKGAYNPEIRREAEEALMPFVEGIFATYKENGEMVFKGASELHQKNPGRFNDFVDKLTGGPQLGELDTMVGKDFAEAVAVARNIWDVNDPRKPVTLAEWANGVDAMGKEHGDWPEKLRTALVRNKIKGVGDLVMVNGRLRYRKGKEFLDFGEFLAETNSVMDKVEEDLGVLSLSRAMSNLFKVKGDAYFSRGFKGGSGLILLGLWKLDRFSGQAELDKNLRELIGSDLTGNNGLFRDADRTFGINMTAYQGGRGTILRMMMNEANTEKANNTFNAGKVILWSKVAGALFGSGGGGKKR